MVRSNGDMLQIDVKRWAAIASLAVLVFSGAGAIAYARADIDNLNAKVAGLESSNRSQSDKLDAIKAALGTLSESIARLETALRYETEYRQTKNPK